MNVYGVLVQRYWPGKPKEFGEKPVLMSFVHDMGLAFLACALGLKNSSYWVLTGSLK
jgi:hypothetical protein